MKKRIRTLSFIIVLLSIINLFISLALISPSSSALSLSPSDISTYSANDIYFYNNCNANSTSSSSSSIGTDVVISGSTAKEKVWSGLKSLGYSDEIVAGLMGNLHRESAEYNPAIFEGFPSSLSGFDYEHNGEYCSGCGHGVGLVQWSFARRVEFFQYAREKANDLVEKYLMHPEKYSSASVKGDNFIQLADNEEEANGMYALEISFIQYELENKPSYHPLLEKKSVEEAAAFASEVYENCGGPCQKGGSEYTARINDAKTIYSEMTGKTITGGGSSSYSSSNSSAECPCQTKVQSSTSSNISFDDDGWISGGIEGYIKDNAKSSPYLSDSAAGKKFNTDMPNGKGKGPNKITLHSTEGPGSGAGNSVLRYFSGFPPNFTIDVRNKKVYQHFSIYETSAAVKSHDDTAGVQIEIFGYSDAALANQRGQSQWILSNFSDSEVEYLADLLKGISKATGIPLKSTVDWSGGSSTVHRLSASKFKSYEGILGHRHVPDNDHWDADGIWDKLKTHLGANSSDSSSDDNNTADNSNSSSKSENIQDDGKNITIIGDSITNGSQAALKEKMKNASIKAQDSKRMFGGNTANPSGDSIVSDLISKHKLRSIVVLALGTNDGVLDQNKVQSLIQKINNDGAHTIVFVTTYGHGRSDGQDFSANNTVFNTIKNTNKNVIIADWASVAKTDPGKYINNSDGLGVHPTAEGQKMFATTIYNAIIGNDINATAYGDDCPSEGSTSNDAVSKLQETVKKFAWPEYHPRDYLTRKQEYIDAVNQGGYHGDDCQGISPGTDCGGFVYQVITKSGWDPDYGGGSGQTENVQKWMANSSTWENVTSSIKSNGDAKPGDVILRSDHVLLFVGKISGFGNVMASASQCHRAPMADYAKDISSYVNDGYEVWRKK